MSYQTPREEQETSINFCAADDLTEIYSADPVTIRKLDKLTEQYPEAYQLAHADKYGKSYTTKKRYIRFGKPASEARKAASRRNALNNLQKAPSLRQNSPSASPNE